MTLTLGEGVVYLGSPSLDYKSPKSLALECEPVHRMLETPHVVDGVLVHVEDVDAHHDRARAAGAEILSVLEDNRELGERRYRAADLEGHRWMFVEAS